MRLAGTAVSRLPDPHAIDPAVQNGWRPPGTTNGWPQVEGCGGFDRGLAGRATATSSKATHGSEHRKHEAGSLTLSSTGVGKNSTARSVRYRSLTRPTRWPRFYVTSLEVCGRILTVRRRATTSRSHLPQPAHDKTNRRRRGVRIWSRYRHCRSARVPPPPPGGGGDSVSPLGYFAAASSPSSSGRVRCRRRWCCASRSTRPRSRRRAWPMA
jgi:hypothetical protein